MPFSAAFLLSFFSWTFTSSRQFRVELYINASPRSSGEDAARALVKKVFDLLHARRNEIKEGVGTELSWKRLDDKREPTGGLSRRNCLRPA